MIKLKSEDWGWSYDMFDVYRQGRSYNLKVGRHLIDVYPTLTAVKKAIEDILSSGSWDKEIDYERKLRGSDMIKAQEVLELLEQEPDMDEPMDNDEPTEPEEEPSDSAIVLKAGDRPDEDFDPDQLAKGIEVEKEHTDDPELAKQIAKGHLVEVPNYYITKDGEDRLKKMEDEARAELSEEPEEEPTEPEEEPGE